VTCTHATAIADAPRGDDQPAGRHRLVCNGKIINTATVRLARPTIRLVQQLELGSGDHRHERGPQHRKDTHVASRAASSPARTRPTRSRSTTSGLRRGRAQFRCPPCRESFVSASGTDWNCSNTNGTVGCTYTAATSLSDGASASPITLVVSVSSAAVSTITTPPSSAAGHRNGVEPLHRLDLRERTVTRSRRTTPRRHRAPLRKCDLTIQKSHPGTSSPVRTALLDHVTDDGPATRRTPTHRSSFGHAPSGEATSATGTG